jgi:hypothetical protein
MNLEFHYYAIRFLAARAGFAEDEAHVLAASSQYVDDSIVAYEVDTGRGPYRTLTTQNYLFWDESISEGVYLPFHFIPGDPDLSSRQRRDGARNPFIVTPDSFLAKSILLDALGSRNLYRVGIALHAYADTWAHQHFTGRTEDANAAELSSPLPPAGHLQVLRSPDEALGLWTDNRLLPGLSLVDNRERFLAAARKIYRYLRTYRREPFLDEDLVSAELEDLWKRDARDMDARIADFCITLDIEPYSRNAWANAAGIHEEGEVEGRRSGYNKFLWLKGEIRRRAGGGDGIQRVDSGGRFEGSELHQWNEAARVHLETARRLLTGAGLLPGRQDP